MAPREAEDSEGQVDELEATGSADLSAGLFCDLFEEAVIGIAVQEVVTDDAGEPVDFRFLAVNEAFEVRAALGADFIEGRRVTQVLPGIVESSFVETCGDVALNGTRVRFEQYAEVQDRFYDVSAFPLGDGLFATTLVDITERKERERELERYEAILGGMDDGAVIVDPEYHIEYANPAVTNFFRMSLSDMRGSHLFEDLQGYARTDATVKRLERTLDGLFEAPADSADAAKLELPLQLHDTTATVEVHCSALSLAGEKRVVLIARDITEHKRREEELARTNERLDSFAGRLAHELRNPLTVISSRLALARETGDAKHFDHLERSLNRMDRLIDDLLVLAKEGEVTVETRPVNLGTIASVCWDVIRSPNTRIRIETEARILADENRLRQLLENLFRNAVEHTGPDTTVTVGDLEEGFFVEDDGGGIPEQDSEAMFERGVTDLAHGTGLGLTVVREMARIHDWSVAVNDGSRGGARFEFRGVGSAGE